MTRAFAWVIVLALAYGAYTAVGKWRNPWSVPSVLPSPAVMSVLPDQPDGCGKSCK